MGAVLSVETVDNQRELHLLLQPFPLFLRVAVREEIVDEAVELHGAEELMFEGKEGQLKDAFFEVGILLEGFAVVSDGVLPLAGLGGFFQSLGEARAA